MGLRRPPEPAAVVALGKGSAAYRLACGWALPRPACPSDVDEDPGHGPGQRRQAPPRALVLARAKDGQLPQLLKSLRRREAGPGVGTGWVQQVGEGGRRGRHTTRPAICAPSTGQKLSSSPRDGGRQLPAAGGLPALHNRQHGVAADIRCGEAATSGSKRPQAAVVHPPTAAPHHAQ